MSGGVIPSGPDGITQGPLQQETAVTAGQPGGISRLKELDQPMAENILKAVFVQGNTGFGQVVQSIFQGLRAGISLPLAILEGVAKKILRLPDNFVFFNVDHVMTSVANWADVLLPDQITQPFVQLVDLLADILGPVPLVGGLMQKLASYFDVLRGKADAAQAAADNVAVAVSQLEGNAAAEEVEGGKRFSDTFDRNETSLGPNYDQASSGVPTGPLRTDGNNAWWNVGGNGQGTRIARITMPLFTNYQGIQVVLNAPLRNMNVADPRVRILLRCNATRTGFVYADLKWNFVEIFKLVSGTTTSLGSAPLPNPSASGDRWTYRAGTDTPDVGEDEFVLHQGTAQALRVQDSSIGGWAGKGVGYEYGGFVLVNGQIQVGLGNVVQDPTKIQSVMIYDRKPSN